MAAPCLGVNTEIGPKIVFWLKFLITLDDNNKESSTGSKRDNTAVKFKLA